jgi:polyisoprenoid-binding protein YceI
MSLLAAAVGSGGAEPTTLAAAPESFTIDPVHSTVVYRIDHMGVAAFYGRFNEIAGDFTFDEADPAASSFNVAIKAMSVDTGNEQRDRHLQSADFFNAREHADITFRSTGVSKAADGAYEVVGDLTLHGVTKPVTVRLRPVGARETRMGYRRGFDAEATIRRSDFGMTTYLENGGLGDEVRLMIGLEGARK